MNDWGRFIHPQSLEEALSLYAAAPAEHTVLAGGTDVFAAARARPGKLAGKSFLCVSRLEEMRGIQLEGNMLSVGAAVTFSEILTSETVETNAGLLKLAVARVASPQIRNLATLGGNVVNASPAADGLTAMICLDAQAELAAWQNGGIVVRRMAVSDLVTGPGRTCRRENEFVVRFLVPSAAGIRCIYEKVGLRSAMAIAVLSLAMVADCRPPQPRIRIALGSLGPKTVVVHEAEKLAESGDIEGSVSLYMKAIRPIDDIRATANYRRTAVKNILLRQIRSVLEESKHESAGEICTKR